MYDPNSDKDEFFDLPEDIKPVMPLPDPVPMPEISMPKRPKWVVALLCVVLALVFTGIGFLTGWLVSYGVMDEGLKTFLWAKEQTQKYYYVDIDNDTIYGAVMKALEDQLDPYSRFYTSADYEALLSESEGNQDGYGFSLASVDGQACLFYVLVNSPVYHAGLRRGMFLYDENGAPLTTQAFMDMTSGGDTVTVKAGSKEEILLTCTLTPSAYTESYCIYADEGAEFAYLTDEGANKLAWMEKTTSMPTIPTDTAYIRLDSFMEPAVPEFEACLAKMKERGKKNLVLDLRYNGGGYMSTLVKIASHLMKNATGNNPYVAKAKYKDGGTIAYYAPKNDYSTYFDEDAKITVLVDRYTASASECLLGAMIDYGTIDYSDIYIQGTGKNAHTYGKGIMQAYYSALNGDVMKLTVASVHWPVSDKCIHGVGVTEEDGAVAIGKEFYELEYDGTSAVEPFLKEVFLRLSA